MEIYCPVLLPIEPRLPEPTGQIIGLWQNGEKQSLEQDGTRWETLKAQSRVLGLFNPDDFRFTSVMHQLLQTFNISIARFIAKCRNTSTASVSCLTVGNILFRGTENILLDNAPAVGLITDTQV